MSDYYTSWEEAAAGDQLLFRTSRNTYERTDPDYAEKIDRRNFDIYAALGDAGERRGFLRSLPPEERFALRKLLQHIEAVRSSPPEALTRHRPPDTLKIEIGTLNRELAAYLSKNPGRLYDMSPRQFEQLVAEILKDMGCDVELTKQTRDGGRDILAAFPSPFGRLLTIVECKRYRADNHVGLDVAERFLWTIDRKDNASFGLIATTSYFSPDVQALSRQFPWRLKLKDFNGVRDWIANYGNWVQDEHGSLWIPQA